MSKQNAASGKEEKISSISETVRPRDFLLSKFSIHSRLPSVLQRSSCIVSGCTMIGMLSSAIGDKYLIVSSSESCTRFDGEWTETCSKSERSRLRMASDRIGSSFSLNADSSTVLILRALSSSKPRLKSPLDKAPVENPISRSEDAICNYQF